MQSLAGITKIEKAFYELGKSEGNLQEYFFTYYSQKLILNNHIYAHIPQILPGFTDHGQHHIKRILNLYGRILQNNIQDSNDDLLSGRALNFYELYILLCGTIWHDVGNVLGRINHGRKAEEVMDRLKGHFFVDEETRKYSLQVAEAHTGEDAIKNCIPSDDVPYMNEEINLRFLGAVLRFADELEEGQVRIDGTYYDSLSENISKDQKIYWEISKCIKRISPDSGKCGVNINARIDNDKIFDLFKKNDNNVCFIDELIFRVDKMNRERINYMKYVRKHVNYKEIILELIIPDRTDLSKIIFKFDDDFDYNRFWITYPDLNPESNIQNYQLRYGDTK
jgi:hypothetical protein